MCMPSRESDVAGSRALRDAPARREALQGLQHEVDIASHTDQCCSAAVLHQRRQAARKAPIVPEQAEHADMRVSRRGAPRAAARRPHRTG